MEVSSFLRLSKKAVMESFVRSYNRMINHDETQPARMAMEKGTYHAFIRNKPAAVKESKRTNSRYTR